MKLIELAKKFFFQKHFYDSLCGPNTLAPIEIEPFFVVFTSFCERSIKWHGNWVINDKWKMNWTTARRRRWGRRQWMTNFPEHSTFHANGGEKLNSNTFHSHFVVLYIFLTAVAIEKFFLIVQFSIGRRDKRSSQNHERKFRENLDHTRRFKLSVREREQFNFTRKMRTSIHSKEITPLRKRLLAELQHPPSTTEIFHLKARFLLHSKLLVIQSAPRGRLCMWESQSCCCHNKISLILSFIATRDDVHTKALDWVLHLDAIEGMLGAEGVVSCRGTLTWNKFSLSLSSHEHIPPSPSLSMAHEAHKYDKQYSNIYSGLSLRRKSNTFPMNNFIFQSATMIPWKQLEFYALCALIEWVFINIVVAEHTRFGWKRVKILWKLVVTDERASVRMSENFPSCLFIHCVFHKQTKNISRTKPPGDMLINIRCWKSFTRNERCF